jgi:2-polyprenyl-6-methoxyphenol hydroxylase-like FAD-dependent oxidoreductase
MTNHTTVLIAGAGPTGLTLAIELARRDVRFRIVDTADGPPRSSRGKGLQPRTLEVFEDLGVLSAVHASGGLYPPFRLHVGPLSFPAGRINKVLQPSSSVPYPNLWLLPQWRTEEILRARLEQFRHRVEFNATLTAFDQDRDGVTATIGTADGVERVHADYLVGCDGGHSCVRKLLGVRFEGEALPTRPVVLADVEIDGLDSSHWHIWPFAKGCVLTLCPLAGTSHFQLAAPLSKRTVPPDTTQDGIRQFLESRIGSDRVCVGRIGWTSVFRPHLRMVDRYRVGRVVLAGDAAHVHPPSGGQGLNTGIQDAYNLGWKLAHVLRGAPDALLDTYESERLPIAAGVLGLSKRLMIKASVKRGAETQQLHLHYRGTPLAIDDGENGQTVVAGDRAPDARCVDADGATRRLFEIFRGTHVTVLAFGCDHNEVPAHETRNGDVRIIPILPPGERTLAGALIDVNGNARRAYGVGDDAALIVVRPDGYIAYLGRPGSWTRIEQCLSLMLFKRATTRRRQAWRENGEP